MDRYWGDGVVRPPGVAVVKHDDRGSEVDRPGKNSDRCFRTGAHVTLCGPVESFHRIHHAANLPDDSPKRPHAAYQCPSRGWL